LMHCGTWLWHASRLPNVRRIYHAGGDVDFDNGFRHLAPRKALRGGKITVFPAIRRYRAGVWPSVAHVPLRSPLGERLSPARLEELLDPHREDLGRWPLYVSLDKDVMGA